MKDRFIAEHHDIRIGAGIGDFDSQTHIVAQGDAGAGFQLIPEFSGKVCRNHIVVVARASHRKDLAGDIFVLLVDALALGGEVILEAVTGLRLQRHGGFLIRMDRIFQDGQDLIKSCFQSCQS